jgi:hypothetical protein
MQLFLDTIDLIWQKNIFRLSKSTECIKFGPLTLMEGWLEIDTENFQNEIAELANKFLKAEHLIDETLAKFKK